MWNLLSRSLIGAWWHQPASRGSPAESQRLTGILYSVCGGLNVREPLARQPLILLCCGVVNTSHGGMGHSGVFYLIVHERKISFIRPAERTLNHREATVEKDAA